jgi:hypothetical protein
LWFEDGFGVYFQLSNFQNSPQVYVEVNQVGDVANVKPSYLQTLQMLELLMLFMMKLVMLLLLCFCNFITL